MTMLIASPPDDEIENQEWIGLSGVGVTVRFRPESDRAQEELRESEQLIESFRRLLVPPESDATEPVTICLDEAPDDIECDILRTEESDTPLAIDLCAVLIRRWFGENAAASTLIVDGIAGTAAAQAGLGPPVEECEKWVSAR